MPAPQPNERVPVEIVYHDDELLIVNKPRGLVTEPGKGHLRDSLLNGLFAEFGNLLTNMGEARDWGLLHRLDKATSGALIVALRTLAYDRLREKFEERHVQKVYLAAVTGAPKPAQGVCQMCLTEVHRNGKKVSAVSRDGKQAITAYKTLAKSDTASLLECRIKTGRLHQIRAHMKHLGCPVIGDDLYAPRNEHTTESPGLMLHAWRLKFGHPIRPVTVDVTVPPPDEFIDSLHNHDLPWPLPAEPEKPG